MNNNLAQTSLMLDECSPKLHEKPLLTQRIKDGFKTSGKTSIYRNGPSAPMKILIEKNLFGIKGSALNFGKGRFEHDTNAIKNITGHASGYDYVYMPDEKVLGSSFDLLYCGYVVNTLKIDARNYVWHQMAKCVRKRGVAFVAARTDKIKGVVHEDGFLTSINTFQKRYFSSELQNEAKSFFKHVVEIKGKSGFSIVACSDHPLNNAILNNAK